jgi:hypothetical protein
MLDRLLRSRAWIWLLGIALGGIVAMQVSLLGMNAGISKSVQTAEDLQHSNAALEEQIAELTGGDRMRNAASDLGLVLPDAGAVDFLKVRPGADARRAADRYTAPSDTARQNLAAGGVPATTVVTDPVPAVTDPTAATTTETAVEPVATPVTPVATTAPVTTTTTTTTETAPPTTAVAPPTTDTGAAEAP